MKAAIVVAGSAVLGAVLGAGLAWSNFGRTPPFVAEPTQALATADANPPQVLVDSTHFDFGKVPADQLLMHTFRFRNAGGSTLVLESGGTTCAKCTIAHLDQPRVAPGQSVDVIVEFRPASSQAQFRQVAAVLTNDPIRPRVELAITGNVTADFELNPSSAQFSKVSSSEAHSLDLTLTPGPAGEVRVLRAEQENPHLAAYFSIDCQPDPQLASSDSESIPWRIRVTVKPGLPLGPFRQTIRLELAVAGREDHPLVEVPVEGSVDGDLSIIGPGWNGDLFRLRLGAIKSGEGATRELFVLVRGAHRHDITLTPAQIEPSWLQVELGAPVDLPSGTITQIPLSIKIPRGMTPGSYQGGTLGKPAKIVLKASLPQIAELPLHVQFTIEP